MFRPYHPGRAPDRLSRRYFSYLGLASLLFWVGGALAGDVKPIPKDGACPPGYYSSGKYCVPRKSANPVIEKQGACPPGYYSNGNYCVGRDNAKDVVEKLGACPPGYYSNGNYCVSRK
ncbi:MAG: hypothetical protein IT487_18385 [Chromatiaceae bacterium]|nr:hypothetical protein [Chromatiaceae bacterium]